MDFNSAIDLIKRELEEAIEIIDDLKTTEGVSRIELELAKSKCRNAASILEHLKAVETVEQDGKNEERPVVKDVEPKPAVFPHSHEHSHGREHEHPHGHSSDDDHVHSHSRSHDEGHEHSHSHSHDEMHEHPHRHEHPHPHSKEGEPFELESNPEESDPDLSITSNNDTSGPGKPYVAPIIADSFSHLASRFNEQLGKEHPEASYLKKRRFAKLTDAIGVNDKFYYIREVFNGDREAYSQVISSLESVDSISEAKKLIMSHRKEKTENEAVKQLLDLVKRKLSPDE